jgi:hypothetical protein
MPIKQGGTRGLTAVSIVENRQRMVVVLCPSRVWALAVSPLELLFGRQAVKTELEIRL